MFALTLACGVGPLATVLYFAYVVSVQALGVQDEDRLFSVAEMRQTDRLPATGVRLDLLDAWHDRTTTTVGMTAYTVQSRVVEGVGDAHRADVASASADFARVLGVRLAAGNLADTRESGPYALVSYQYWRSRLQQNASVIGQIIRLDGTPYPITGVIENGFRFPNAATAIWLVGARLGSERTSLPLIIKLKDGVGAADAVSEATSVLKSMRPDADRVMMRVMPLREAVFGNSRDTLLRLGAACAIALGIAALNLINLVMARLGQRSTEDAIRVALGGSRRRLLESQLTEVAAASAPALALVPLLSVGFWFLLKAWLRAPAGFVELRMVPLTLIALGLAVMVCVTTTSIAALLAVGRPQPTNLWQRGTGQTPTLAARSWRHFSIALQSGGATVLVLLSILMLVTHRDLSTIDMGFSSSHLLVAELNVPRWPEHRRSALLETLTSEMQRDPSVTAVGLALGLPPTRNVMRVGFHLPEVSDRSAPLPHVSLRLVTPGFFQALGTRLRDGRYLTGRPSPQTRREAVVNEQFMRLHGAALVDRMVYVSRVTQYEIIGVVDDIRTGGPSEPIEPELYTDYLESGGVGMVLPGLTIALAVRTTDDPLKFSQTLRNSLVRVDPVFAAAAISTMDDRLRDALRTVRLRSAAMSAVSALAVVLATVGLYALAVQHLGQRHKEIAIRVALGASGHDILRAVAGREIGATLLGAAVGLACFGLSATAFDYVSYGAAKVSPAAMVLTLAAVAGIGVVAFAPLVLAAYRSGPANALRES